jgi:dienelactone hydrolase
VPAYLVVPSGKGPFAVILFGHWGGGDRTEFLAEAILDARAGAVCLLPAYPWTRPAPWRRALQYVGSPENDFEAYVQAVVDLRRGLDLLLARPDVDPQRVAYVGHSYGAQWGAILAAEDRRMKTAVLIAGVPDVEAMFLESEDPELVGLRTQDHAAVDHRSRLSPHCRRCASCLERHPFRSSFSLRPSSPAGPPPHHGDTSPPRAGRKSRNGIRRATS